MPQKEKQNRLVVGDNQWANDIPKWLLEEIKTECLIYGLSSITNPEIEKVGDAEVVAYLMTASLHGPMPNELNQIYIYLGAKLVKRRSSNSKLPDFMEEKLKQGLTDYEQRELKELKSMIYSKRGGEINHPILNVMRRLYKDSQNPQQKLF